MGDGRERNKHLGYCSCDSCKLVHVQDRCAVLREACPDDLREAGWSVAVHNDYSQDGRKYTFWLFTHHDGRWIKGEGRTDAEALRQIRAVLSA